MADQSSLRKKAKEADRMNNNEDEISGIDVQGDLESEVNPTTSEEELMTDLRATRSELEIKKNLRKIKEQCGELQDQDKAVACFSEAQKADTEITRAIKGEQ